MNEIAQGLNSKALSSEVNYKPKSNDFNDVFSEWECFFFFFCSKLFIAFELIIETFFFKFTNKWFYCKNHFTYQNTHRNWSDFSNRYRLPRNSSISLILIIEIKFFVVKFLISNIELKMSMFFFHIVFNLIANYFPLRRVWNPNNDAFTWKRSQAHRK